MSEPFLGEIKLVGFNFPPRGWAECNGQLLPIAQNSALFSLLGTIYGGDGRTTFGLPDLRGRYAMHQGQGPGLSSRPIGQKSGEERVTLATSQLPSHQHGHTLRASGNPANTNDPTGNILGLAEAYSDQPDSVNMDPNAIDTTNAGGGQAHNNMPPYQCVNFIIALTGIFPSRA